MMMLCEEIILNASFRKTLATIDQKHFIINVIPFGGITCRIDEQQQLSDPWIDKLVEK